MLKDKNGICIDALIRDVKSYLFLVLGGLMVLFNLGIDENGSYTGSTGVGNLYKAMNNTLHDITNRGVIAKVRTKVMLIYIFF